MSNSSNIVGRFTESLISSDAIPTALSALVGLPSAVLYALEVVFLYRGRREFNSAFFVLFIVRAIPAIVNLANNWNFRFGLLGWFLPFFQRVPTAYFNALFFFAYFANHVENVSTPFLVLNRFTAIAWPLANRKIWCVLLPCSCAATFLVPFFLTAPILAQSFGVRIYDGTSFGFEFPNDNDHDFYEYQGAVAAAVAMSICAVLNVASAVAYHKVQRSTNLNANPENNPNAVAPSTSAINTVVVVAVSQQQKKMEFRLHIYTFCTFLSQLCMGISWGYFYLCYSTPNFARPASFPIRHYFYLLNDLCNVAIPAWLMFWASSKLRETTVKEWRSLKTRLTN